MKQLIIILMCIGFVGCSEDSIVDELASKLKLPTE